MAELERIGWDYDFASESEVKCRCPFHDDKSPSCSVNVEKRVFKCQTAGCGAEGDFLTFLAKALKSTRRVVLEDLKSRYDLREVRVVDSTAVERYHTEVWSAAPLLKELHNRGVTDEMIRKYRLGVNRGRVTIPIPNENGLWVNVRRYLPGAPGKDKMRNTRGHGKVRLYPVSQLTHERIVICGGEMKAIVAAELLNPLGIGAVTATAGEGNWEVGFSRRFRDKQAWVMYDVDEAGLAAADKICARVRGEARWVGKVHLPLDVERFPHGDVNDWVGVEHATAKDLLKLLEGTDEWVPQSLDAYAVDEDATAVHLSEAVKAKYAGRRVSVGAVITAMDTAPYVVPSRIRVICEKNEDRCSLCPVFAEEPGPKGLVELDISPESPAVLEMVAAPKRALRDALMTGLRIPDCKTVEFSPLAYQNVEDVRLSPQLEISSRQAGHMMQPALCIGHGLELNETYELAGRMFPDPKTQQSVLLISTYVATQDALSKYSPTDDQLEELAIFQPAAWTVEGVGKKLDDLYDDLETNVTRIFQRRDLHVVVDLAYHSPLLLHFDRRTEKGWVEILVLGDSSQGKSETTLQLMRHYGLGEKMECKNATVAGMLGGLQQMGTRWFVTWGIIPTHDRRLVVLEELKGASTEVIGKLTDMRSSGIAEIPKIEKRRTHARTRLIALSNPRSDHPLSTYNFGVEAVHELIGGLEDVRRFDACLLVAATDVDAETLNRLQRSRPKIEQRHTAELCRRCILWAWTREPEQVAFTDKSYELILDAATRLCSRYTEVIPIVDRGSMRFKLARLSAALACRTFSHARDNLRVVVIRPCHVRFIADFLDRVYSHPTFGYLDYSRAIDITKHLISPDMIEARIIQTPFPNDFVEQLLHTNDIELRDICDWCGWEKGDGIQLLSFLVRKHALRRSGRAYRKTPTFIELLKTLQTSEKLAKAERPEHIGEEF